MLCLNQFLSSSKDDGYLCCSIGFDISGKPPNPFPTSSTALKELKHEKFYMKQMKYLSSFKKHVETRPLKSGRSSDVGFLVVCFILTNWGYRHAALCFERASCCISGI